MEIEKRRQSIQKVNYESMLTCRAVFKSFWNSLCMPTRASFIQLRRYFYQRGFSESPNTQKNIVVKPMKFEKVAPLNDTPVNQIGININLDNYDHLDKNATLGKKLE